MTSRKLGMRRSAVFNVLIIKDEDLFDLRRGYSMIEHEYTV